MSDIDIKVGASSAEMDAAMAKAKASVSKFASDSSSEIKSATPAFEELGKRVEALTAAIEKSTASSESNQAQWTKAIQQSAAASAATEQLTGRMLQLNLQIASDTAAIRSNSDAWVTWAKTGAVVAFAGYLLYQQFKIIKAGMDLATQGAVYLGQGLLSAAQSAANYILSLNAVSRETELLTAAETRATLQIIAANGAMQNFAAGAKAAGFDTITGYIANLASTLAKIPGMTNAGATSIVGVLAQTRDFTAQTTAALVAAIPLLASTEEEAKAVATQMAAAFGNPAANGQAFLDSLKNVPAEIQRAFDAAKTSMDGNAERAALLNAILDRIKRTQEGTLLASQEQVTIAEKNVRFWGIFDYIFGGTLSKARESLTVQEKTTAAAAAAAEKLREMVPSIRSMSVGGAEFERSLQTVLGTFKSIGQQIDENNAKLKILQQATGGGSGDAAAMIRREEDFKPKAYRDVNHYRVGYGSDTTTDESGKQHEVTADTVTTRLDAERDLARRIVDIQRDAAGAIGPAWDKLSDKAKASITSVGYNYGKVPQTVATAAYYGDEGGIAGAISSLPANPARRQREAANITNGPGVSNQSAVEESTKRIVEDNRRLNDIKAGGSALERGNLEILERVAAENITEVEGQKKKIELLEREIDKESDIGKKAQLRSQLATEQISLKAKEAAATKAAADVEVEVIDRKARMAAAERAAKGANDTVLESKKRIEALKEEMAVENIDAETRKSKEEQIANEMGSLRSKETAARRAQANLEVADMEIGSAKRRDILNKNLAAEASTLRKGSAERIAIELEMKNNTEAVDNAVNTKKAADSESNFNREMNRLKVEATEIRSNYDEKRITATQMTNLLKANLDAQEAAERAHQAQLKDIWGESTSQFDAAQKRMTEIASEQAVKRANLDRQQNKIVFNDYKSTFEGIGQNLSSSTMQMLKGQMTFGQALQSLAGNITQTFISAGFKRLAAWAAEKATELTVHTTTEAGKTVATAAGDTARLGITSSTAVAGLAVEKTVGAASVQGSAAKGAAATYASISEIPIIGPILAPPAAALAYGAITAFGGGFAQGHWELPQDSPILAHKGEMIVPQNETPWVQSLMQQAMGGGGGGSGGGEYHAHLYLDGKQIAKSVSKAQASAPSSRPTY